MFYRMTRFSSRNASLSPFSGAGQVRAGPGVTRDRGTFPPRNGLIVS
jgi:hypothetical protein